MSRVLPISPEEAMHGNKAVYTLEVGSDYEKYSINSARKFIGYIRGLPVVDLGAGDGAATNVFTANGNSVTAVDINPDKLRMIKGAETVEQDIVSFLSKPVENVFMHHVLEHIPNYQDVLDLIAKHLKKGRYCFIAVPKDDHPHSVHYVAFDSLEEIIPSGLQVVERWETGWSGDTWPELGVIARKA